jgi:hypothetical protein
MCVEHGRCGDDPARGVSTGRQCFQRESQYSIISGDNSLQTKPPSTNVDNGPMIAFPTAAQ